MRGSLETKKTGLQKILYGRGGDGGELEERKKNQEDSTINMKASAPTMD